MAVSSITQAQNTIKSGSDAMSGNYEMFLKLLTTQLKNQDPLSPLDNNQFTQQLTQMTGVQQQLLTNQLLTQLIGQGQADMGGGAVNLIGKLVTVDNNQAVVEAGKAQWTYELPTIASETKLSILDAAGRTVWSGVAASNAKGSHTLDWDGKDLSGRQVTDGGTYRLKIEAEDLNGGAMTATASVTGLASRLQVIDGQTLLTVGKIKAPLTAVTGVQTAPS